MDSGSDS